LGTRTSVQLDARRLLRVHHTRRRSFRPAHSRTRRMGKRPSGAPRTCRKNAVLRDSPLGTEDTASGTFPADLLELLGRQVAPGAMGQKCIAALAPRFDDAPGKRARMRPDERMQHILICSMDQACGRVPDTDAPAPTGSGGTDRLKSSVRHATARLSPPQWRAALLAVSSETAISPSRLP